MMNRKMTLSSILVGLVAILFLNSCGPSQVEIDSTNTKAAAEMFATQTAEAPTSTPIPTNTPTSIPPTASPTSIPPTATLEPLPGLIPEGIVVTFSTREKCNISSPTELPAGEYAFILNEVGDYSTGSVHHLTVSYLSDGNTTQDLLKHPKVGDGKNWGNALELLVDAKALDAWRNESRSEIYYIYSLEEGEHVVLRFIQMPQTFWYCGTILVK
jgi:hypothetical protein